MPRTLNRLTVKSVENYPAGTYSDGGNLFLIVSPAGSRRWMFKYKTKTLTAGQPGAKGANRKSREMGLGTFPEISLARARELASDARRILASGGDPIDERRIERRQRGGTSFGDVAVALHAAKLSGWRNARHRNDWISSLRTYAAPIWGKPVSQITVSDIEACLRPIWTTLAETASRVRGRMEQVLDAARVQGLIPEDRANSARWKGNLTHLLPARPRLQRGHLRSMPYADVPAFMERLAQRDSISSKGLRFLILTAARSGEVMGATWREIDRDARTWTVPGSRMKAGRMHSVPLTDATLSILDSLAPLAGSAGDYIFPGQKTGKPLSNMAFEMLMRAMSADAVPHGFRSSFRVWSAEQTTIAPHIAEMCLAHLVGTSVERAYQRSDLLTKRRQLLELWADHCLGKAVQGADVIQLRPAGTK